MTWNGIRGQITGRRLTSRLALLAADLAIAAVAFAVASWVRFGEDRMFSAWDAVLRDPTWVFAGYLALLIAVLAIHRLYDVERIWSYATELMLVTRASMVFGLILAFSMVVFKLEGVSRLFLFIFLPLQYIGVLGVRWVTRWLFARRANAGDVQHVLIIGAGPFGRSFAGQLNRTPGSPFKVVGFLDDERAGSYETIDGLPLLGSTEDLAAVLHRQVVDSVFITLPFAALDMIHRLAHVCEEEGKTVHVTLDVVDTTIAKSKLEVLMGSPVLTLTTTPDQTAALFAKRAIDLVGSLAALMLLSPVLLGIALAIKLDSSGPVFFRQRRVGLHGREFNMWKFRTMVVDAEARLGQLREKNEVSGPVFKMRNDPRRTRMGCFLRRTSLDELPNLINVLRGEMSLVGPRPPLPGEVAQYEPWQRRRLSMKPGMTCVWQVDGRNDIPFEEWVRLDLGYIDSWSLWLDLKILAKTIPVVFRGTGM